MKKYNLKTKISLTLFKKLNDSVYYSDFVQKKLGRYVKQQVKNDVFVTNLKSILTIIF